MKVLIVIDMQNDFVHGALGTAEAQAIVPNVVNKLKYWPIASGKVYFTRDTHDFNYMNTLEGKNLPVQHCVKESAGWCVIDELLPYAAKAKVVDKTTFGYCSWNMEFCSYKEIEFELCGVCTDICVISNALALRMFYPNAKITVDASCCAGVTPEKHKAALEVMKSCQINVIGE